MNFRKVGTSLLIFGLFSLEAKAEQLVISSDGSIPGLSVGTDFSNNTGEGILITAAKPGGLAWEIITTSDITVNQNSPRGIYATRKVHFIGNGNNTLFANQNKNASNTDGIGIYASGTSAVITISDMNVETDSNLRYGIDADSGGKINITSSSGNNFINANNNKLGINYGVGIFAGSSGEVNIHNMNIYANNNGIKGIMASTDSKVIIHGNGSNVLEANNNSQDGIQSTASNTSYIEITDMNITADNNGRYGINSHNNGAKVYIKGNNNTLVLENNVLAGVYAGSLASSVAIEGMNISASGNTLFNAESTGEIRLNNVVSNISDNSLLFSASSGVGKFNVDSSTINNKIQTSAGAVSNVILKNTTWSNIAQSNITNLELDNAKIHMITTSQNPADSEKLTIENSSAGSGVLYITHMGNDDPDAEVLVVDQNAVSDANAQAVFSLFGGKINDGAFEYELFKGDINGVGNNHYLRSTGKMTDIAKTIANLPAISLYFVKTGMDGLRKRMGELRENDPQHKEGLWAKSYAKSLKVDESIDSKMKVFGFETGYDHQVYADCDNKAYAGLIVGYLYTDHIKTRNDITTEGRGHANTPTIGAYATWLNQKGWFVDTVVRHFWSNLSMTTYTAQDLPVDYEAKRQFTAGSLETGHKMAWEIDSTSQYTIEPNTSLTYVHANAKNFKTSTDRKIKYDTTDSLQARLGIKLGYNKELENGSVIEPFIDFGVIREFDGITDINYNGVDYKSDVSGTSYEFSVGLNSKINDNWNFYGDVGYETGSVIQVVSANLGVRYNF